jgi:O-methyltransferase
MNLPKEATNNTVVDRPRLFKLVEYCKQTEKLPGSIAEVGVWKGGTAFLLASNNPNKHLYLFDTFEGMPESIKGIDLHKKGDFKNTSLEYVQELLKPHKNVSFHKGLFPKETSDVIKDEKFSLVHLDCDIYTSVKESLEFFYNRTVPNGIIVFDDYNAPTCPGAKLAVDEFLKDKPEKLINFVQDQVAIIKL